LGCIPNRRFAMAVPIHNQSDQSITILTVGGSQPHPRIVRRMAIQAWPDPQDNRPFALVHKWSRTPGRPLVVPADTDAWLQLNFLMRRCNLIKRGAHVPVSDILSISYQDEAGMQGVQATPPIVPLILTRASKDAIDSYRANPSPG